MIVCLCNSVSCSAIKSAAKDSEKFKECLGKSGIKPKCGKCIIMTKEIYDDITNDVSSVIDSGDNTINDGLDELN